jgi:hypothetical protein
MVKQPLNWGGRKMTTTLQKPDFEIITVKPVFGVNYNKGYIGFTYNGNHPIGRGIAYFTKWDKISNIYATHVLIVIDEDSCIEADAGTNCVKKNPLHPYFDNPNCQIFFRKPKGLTNEIAQGIVEVLEPEEGKKYDFKLILAHAFSGTLAGYLCNRLLQGKLEMELSKILDCPSQWICSELAAYALDEQDEYRDKGILKQPNATISPQELFEDSVIFEPWKYKTVTEYSDGHTHC